MRSHTVRTVALGALTTAALAFPAASALGADSQSRILGLPVPDLGQVVTDVGQTVGGVVDPVLPGTGAIVTETTGTVGGIITGTTDTLNSTVDQTVGSILDGSGLDSVLDPITGTSTASGGGLLPTDTLNTLLQTLGIPTLSGTGAGQSVAPDGSIIVDGRAPSATFKVLSRLRAVKRDGKLKLQVSIDEAGVVAFTSTVRPGVAVKTKKAAKKKSTRKTKARRSAAAKKHSRKVIHVPAVTLGFRKAGVLKVTVQLSKAAQRNLGASKNARISVGLLAADAARNQISSRVKQTVKR